jgi:hypothetical protein
MEATYDGEYVKFADVAAHLARQSQAAQPSVSKITDTDSARAFLLQWMMANFPSDKSFGAYIQTQLAGDFAYQLARALAGQSQATKVQAVPDLYAAIMNLPCNPPDGWGGIQQTGYKIGHRDARHAAAELANESEAAQEVTQQAAPTLQDWLKIIHDDELTPGDRLQRISSRINAILAEPEGNKHE